MGSVDEKQSFELLDFFYQQGGNFIDTASNYQNEQSETIIGNWMEARGNRDEMVIATKYTTGWKTYQGRKIIQSNFGGMNAKSLRHSLEGSLKKLQTSFVDVLYIHWWDMSADIPEVMHALHDMVQQGKVLYLGISDTPAWIVAKANEYARCHHLRPFVVYQGKWNIAFRDMEREILPMCRAEGMGIAPWGAIGGGNFKTKAQREEGGGRVSMFPPTENELKIIDKLEELAKRKGTQMTSVALAYVMHKVPYVFPIVGGRTTKHLQGNIDALNLEITREEIDELEAVAPFDLGFPMNLMAMGKNRDVSNEPMAADHFGNSMFVRMHQPDLVQPIQAGRKK